MGCIPWLQLPLHFYPRSPCGERHRFGRPIDVQLVFLSTLSLRRATAFWFFVALKVRISIHALLAESDNINSSVNTADQISIHALLAESDSTTTITTCIAWKFLSTLSLRRATRTGLTCGDGRNISIHALLAESDEPAERHANSQQEFLSTLSLRRATISHFIPTNGTLHFYPRSPCGERPIRL